MSHCKHCFKSWSIVLKHLSPHLALGWKKLKSRQIRPCSCAVTTKPKRILQRCSTPRAWQRHILLNSRMGSVDWHATQRSVKQLGRRVSPLWALSRRKLLPRDGFSPRSYQVQAPFQLRISSAAHTCVKEGPSRSGSQPQMIFCRISGFGSRVQRILNLWHARALLIWHGLTYPHF